MKNIFHIFPKIKCRNSPQQHFIIRKLVYVKTKFTECFLIFQNNTLFNCRHFNLLRYKKLLGIKFFTIKFILKFLIQYSFMDNMLVINFQFIIFSHKNIRIKNLSQYIIIKLSTFMFLKCSYLISFI